MALSEQQKVIGRFAQDKLDVGIDCWPDEVNRVSPDIDALAGDGRFAIEHTSLDSFPNQRERAAQFMRVVGGLPSELARLMQFRLEVTFHVSAIERGQDWAKTRENIKAWVLTESAELTYGIHTGFQIPGAPFLATVDKGDPSWKPQLVFRRDGRDEELEPDDDQVRRLLESKASKLRPYSESGKTTILLVESRDIALMNPWLFCEIMERLFGGGRPAGVDQIWFADCCFPEELEFHRC